LGEKEVRGVEASPRDPRVLRVTEEVYLMDAGSWSALYRVPGGVILSRPGSFRTWGRTTWSRVVREAEGKVPGLAPALRELASRLSQESALPVTNLDRSPPPAGFHRLRVEYSRREGFIRVRGWTFLHSDRLRALGLRYEPGERCWAGKFSPRTLAALRRMVEKEVRG
jgi:hypothetical protein